MRHFIRENLSLLSETKKSKTYSIQFRIKYTSEEVKEEDV